MRISHSQMESLFQCPMKWKLQKLDKVPEEKSISLLFGSAIHEAIEQGYKNQKHPRTLWNDIWEKTLADNPHIRQLPDIKKYDNDVAYKIWETFRPLEPIALPDNKPAVEVWWETDLGFLQRPNDSICGKIDIIYRPKCLGASQDTIVGDYKTGKSKPIPKSSKNMAGYRFVLDHSPQFTMYAWAVKHVLELLDDEVIKCAYIHLREYEEFHTQRVSWHNQALLESIQYFFQIVDGGFFPRCYGDHCMSFCSYFGKTCSDACPYTVQKPMEYIEATPEVKPVETVNIPAAEPISAEIKELFAPAPAEEEDYGDMFGFLEEAA